MRRLALLGALGLGSGAALGIACSSDTGQDCIVGSRGCPCTAGGACDSTLSCIDGLCVQINTTDDSADSAMTSADGSGDQGMSSDGGVLDVGGGTTGPLPDGCRKIDVLFVLDSSASMGLERQGLAATGSFTAIVDTLAGLNGGGIEYRIGVTDDNDRGFYTPAGWVEPNPWFDANDLDTNAIVAAFNGAVTQIDFAGGTPLGCEHVLTSAVTLLATDTSGFLRDDALLVLVLVTDVDDYGAYDQIGGNSCGVGCGTVPQPVPQLFTSLVDNLKGGQADAVAAVVVAGDPSQNGGLNICQQPGSCCGGADCQVFHADRLWEFAGMLGGTGFTSNLCNTNAATALAQALVNEVDLACMDFVPAG